MVVVASELISQNRAEQMAMTLTRDGEPRCMHEHGDDQLTCGRVVVQEIEVEVEVDDEVVRCAVNTGSMSPQNHPEWSQDEKYPVLTDEGSSLSDFRVKGPFLDCW